METQTIEALTAANLKSKRKLRIVGIVLMIVSACLLILNNS